MLVQGCQRSGTQDLRVAMLLLLVSRTVKDEGALTELGGPSLFVDLLEDDDACIRHAAATFLEVGLLMYACIPSCETTLQVPFRRPASLQPASAGCEWLGQLTSLDAILAGAIVRAHNIKCCM